MPEVEAAWRRLKEQAAESARRRIVDFFAEEPDRMERLTLDAAGLHLDFSKQPWTLAAFDAALNLARAAEVEAARARLFAGEAVNRTENRPAMHMALRAPDGASFAALGQPVSGEVEAERARMKALADAVRSGEARGCTGRPYRSIVHIGIGGSDLGPRLVWEALRPLDALIELRFAGNVDGFEIAQALHGLDPAETLVIAVSKTFTTQETLANARAARAWLRDALGEASDAHLYAVSTNLEATAAFGVARERTFAFWDWVGGRYSLWSTVGLSCAIGLGWETFQALLDGAAAMDAHFLAAPLERNAPALLALAHVFNRDGLSRPTRAVVPYAQRLRLLPAFLQQLEMESNGKSVDQDGAPVAHGTATAVFGEPGTNGQHAFFQMLHQGTDIIPVDIVAAARADDGPPEHQAMLNANALAQAEALMVGRQGADLPPHRRFAGNRPTAMILIDHLEPRTLGALIALYEHKVFVEGVLWGIDSFDQWGVELGKAMASAILPELEGGPVKPHDPSTAALIARLRSSS